MLIVKPDRTRGRYQCVRCHRLINYDAYYMSDSGKYFCFGCLCVVNPTLALEVIRTAYDLTTPEMEDKEDEEESSVDYAGSLPYASYDSYVSL